MIGRMWHGWTTKANANHYQHYLETHILPLLGKIPGHTGAQVFRRDDNEEIEFITLTFFDSIDAVRRFAGDNYENAVVTEEAHRLLSRYDSKCAHYELALHAPLRNA